MKVRKAHVIYCVDHIGYRFWYPGYRFGDTVAARYDGYFTYSCSYSYNKVGVHMLSVTPFPYDKVAVHLLSVTTGAVMYYNSGLIQHDFISDRDILYSQS